MVRAAGFLQGIGQYRHVGEVAAAVHLLGHRDEQAVVSGKPGGIDSDGVEGVADYLLYGAYSDIRYNSEQHALGCRQR